METGNERFNIMRTATSKDFKLGTTLVCKSAGWEVTIVRQYGDGIWEAKGNGGIKCVFECEASGYNVKETENV